MFMNRLGRIPFFIMLGGALLLPYGLHAQDKDQQDIPADKQQDSGKKNGDNSSKPPDKAKNLKKLQKELATPYKKWLEEEVPYIISDEERTAFLQLQTNEEREEFIEAFWQRRNPDPGLGGKRVQGRVLPPHRLRQRAFRFGNPRLEDRPRPHLHHLGTAR